jgi:hypothetical protein
MTFYRIPSPRKLEMEDLGLYNYSITVIKIYALDIVVSDVGSHYLFNSHLDSINYCCMISVRWYVSCFVNYPRWSNNFRLHMSGDIVARRSGKGTRH